VILRVVQTVAFALMALVDGAWAQTAAAGSASGAPAYEGKTVSEWQAQLHDNVPEYRIRAAYALASFGPAARSAIPALCDALHDGTPTVRYAAAWALGEMGPAAKSALPALEELLDDDVGDVRWSAKKAIKKIRDSGSGRVPAEGERVDSTTARVGRVARP
jgi:HEAT repeats